jgi:hypothetical protein
VSQSLACVLIHLVFSTKNRDPLIPAALHGVHVGLTWSQLRHRQPPKGRLSLSLRQRPWRPGGPCSLRNVQTPGREHRSRPLQVIQQFPHKLSLFGPLDPRDAWSSLLRCGHQSRAVAGPSQTV